MTEEPQDNPMNPGSDSSRSMLQLVWGVALLLAGVGVFIRIPQVMPQLSELEVFAGATGIIRFCFYLIGIILIGGGIRKVMNFFKKPPSASPPPQGPADPQDI